ncbi:site-specific integrase [Pseudomonas aeruginosa]|uniref:site-specific integrase n=1 Tax=Pseudomonas aeruginosa TaxID=287 RepID=UPI0028FFE050|nr:site-specific integrase [Pseudomonas aeruginosa]MDU0701898.1 site-specific integrase [Pseudomonas aeruginosa]
MIIFERKIISYTSPEIGLATTHYILIAKTTSKDILLSHPNLFLYSNTRSSLRTSARYSSVIAMFYRFLSNQEKFYNSCPSQYHALVDNKDIKQWQVSRQIARVATQNAKPSSETIFEDAKVLLTFFNWLNGSGYLTNVDIRKNKVIASFNRSKMLSYVQAKARVSIDSKNIRVLDKEARQSERRTLITDSEIRTYLQCFTDPVYKALFKLALGTAMRPMDLCGFPFLGNGKNAHIMPYSEMDHDQRSFEYTVYGSKGNKTRTIIINGDDLKELDEQYIKPFYEARRMKYKKRFGHDCPPSILFLNSRGLPVTPSKIASRGNAAKMKAVSLDENFRESVTFYESRHWWPTMFLICFFKEDILKENVEVLWAACGEILINQMGHEDIETTFAYYIDMARVVVLANKGRVTELVRYAQQGVHSFIEELNRGALAL